MASDNVTRGTFSEKYFHNLGHILDLNIQNYLTDATKHLLTHATTEMKFRTLYCRFLLI